MNHGSTLGVWVESFLGGLRVLSLVLVTLDPKHYPKGPST